MELSEQLCPAAEIIFYHSKSSPCALTEVGHSQSSPGHIPGVGYPCSAEQRWRSGTCRQIELNMQKGDGMYFEGDMGFKSISDKQDFYLDGDNLVICFGQYEIAPYASGMPEFKIPLAFLKPNLNEHFLSLVTH